MKKYDLIIVGGGVIGTFCAFNALKLKKSVLLIEKDSTPYEASFRNFGQGVPSGQTLDKWFEYGRKSLEIYKEIQTATDISLVQNGSWYIASDEFEATLIEELHQILQDKNYASKLYNKEDCLNFQPNLQNNYVKAGLFFPQEVSLNPLIMVHEVRNFLINQFGLDYLPNTAVIGVEKKRGVVKIDTALKKVFWSDQIILANGKDTQFLLPEFYPENLLSISKLQMLRLKKQAPQIKSNLLTGLTIRRYGSFKSCPSYKQKPSNPHVQKLENHGIHILFKQATDGSIILGDSHAYQPANQIGDFGFEVQEEINQLMLEEAKKIIQLDTWELDSTWNGFYLQTQNDDIYLNTVDDIIHIINGIGGKGMTTSPGFTKEFIHSIFSR